MRRIKQYDQWRKVLDFLKRWIWDFCGGPLIGPWEMCEQRCGAFLNADCYCRRHAPSLMCEILPCDRSDITDACFNMSLPLMTHWYEPSPAHFHRYTGKQLYSFLLHVCYIRSYVNSFVNDAQTWNKVLLLQAINCSNTAYMLPNTYHHIHPWNIQSSGLSFSLRHVRSLPVSCGTRGQSEGKPTSCDLEGRMGV